MPSHRAAPAALGAILAASACAPRRVVPIGPPSGAGEKNPFAEQAAALTRFRIRNTGDKDTEAAEAALRAEFLEYARRLGGWRSLAAEAPPDSKVAALEVDVTLGLEDRKDLALGFPVFFPLWGPLWPITPRSGHARVTGTVSLLDSDRRLVGAKTATRIIPFKYSLYGWFRTRPIEDAFRTAYEGVFARLAAPEVPDTAPDPSDSLPPSPLETPGYSSPERPADYALIVGVERYAAAGTAPFGERDARAMRRHLIALGYPESNVVLLAGETAGKSSLEKALEQWLPRRADRSSRVTFYFSGLGASDPKSGEPYLLPYDADPQFLEETAIPLRRVYARLSKLKSARALAILDAGFSGSGPRSFLRAGSPVSTLAPEGARVFALTASGDGSWIDAGAGHGTFTLGLLRALEEQKGRLELPDLVRKARPGPEMPLPSGPL